MEFAGKLDYIVKNMSNLTFGEVKEFASTLDKNVEESKKEITKQLDLLQMNYKKFTEIYISTKKNTENKKNFIIKEIGGVEIKFPLIKTVKETKNYSGIPCALEGIKNWLFIDFPTLNQILPVKSSFSFSDSSNLHTKINYEIFKKIPLDQLNTDFAIIPFTADTWQRFEEIPYNKWENYLNQLNLDWKCMQKLPISETTGMVDIAKTISPEQMAIEWSLFVQLYFLLYIFRFTGEKKHFTY